ncbi:MAG: hypothetical protein ACYCWE_04275 [Eubacteriales bacterium]
MKRFLCILVSVFTMIIMASAASCNVPSADPIESVSNESETNLVTQETADFPDADYEGHTIEIYYQYISGSYYEDYLFRDQLTGEVVDDAIYNRNINLCQKYNIDLNFTEMTDNTQSQVQKVLMAGDTIDLVCMSSVDEAALSVSGMMYDLNTFDYLDFSKPWWDHKIIDQLSIKNHVYIVVSDISVTALNSANMIFFNKYLIDQYQLSDPYDLVYANEWTFENFASAGRKVSEDLNGDGAMDDNDRYGLLEMNTRWLMHGSNLHLTEKNAGDEIVLADLTGEHLIAVFDVIRQLTIDETISTAASSMKFTGDISGYSNRWEYTRFKLFPEDHFLFMMCGIWVIDSGLRDMEHDFGVVPIPKWSSDQESYCMTVDPNIPMFSVPITCSDTDEMGMVLEYWSYLSRLSLYDAYYEITLKDKITRDSEAADMLDIMRNNMSYEFTYTYPVYDIHSVIDSSLSNGNIVSAYAAKETAIIKAVDDFNASIPD